MSPPTFLVQRRPCIQYTLIHKKPFPNLIKSNQIWIVITLFQLILHIRHVRIVLVCKMKPSSLPSSCINVHKTAKIDSGRYNAPHCTHQKNINTFLNLQWNYMILRGLKGSLLIGYPLYQKSETPWICSML